MNEDQQRDTLLEEAFTESGGTVGTLKLRKFSLASVNLCKRMGITLVMDSRVLKGDEEAGIQPLGEQELQRQLVSFIWAHHAPVDEVIDALEDGTWKRKVSRFEFDLPLDAMPEMMAQLVRVAQRAEAAAVEVVKKPGATEDKDAPPKS